MVSLVDIKKSRKMVPLRGDEVEVRGLAANYIAELLAGSNELRLLLAEKALSPDLVVSLVTQLPMMIAQVIAFGVSKRDDDATIRFILDELTPEEVVDLLSAILELSFSRGIPSFIAGVVEAARRNGLDVPGWDQVMKSRDQSSSASPTATAPQMPGTTLPASSMDGSNSSEEKPSSASAA